MSETLIRRTWSVCPECLEELPARVVEDRGMVFLRKDCPEHGTSECLLSRHAWYYEALDRYFFAVMPEEVPQRDYLIRVNERCNLKCPICLASAVDSKEGPPPTPDMDLERLEAFMDTHPRGALKIDLISAEPTLRKDLPEILRAIKSRGHISSLHTNGVRLADREYLRTLKNAGLDEVFLQMDGFDDQAYLKIRGARLTQTKIRVLENLEAEGVATSLVMVVMPGCNEAEIPKVLDYAATRPFIREVMFLGTRALGYFRGSDELLMPDQVIDLVEDLCGGLCPRPEVFRFQKLYFALLSLLGVRKCLYVQHYLLIRDGGGFANLDRFINWAKVEPVLDELPHTPRTSLARLAWLFRLGLALLSPKTLRLLPDFLSLFLRLKFGWRLRRLPFRPLLIGYITACDPVNLDRRVGHYCGKGELAMDLGLHESGSEANIERERMWARLRRSCPPDGQP
jgi:pyruvate-formate lyase-activating enzyme